MLSLHLLRLNQVKFTVLLIYNVAGWEINLNVEPITNFIQFCGDSHKINYQLVHIEFGNSLLW